MEFLLIVVLGAVCAWLWQKLETLRSDHALLEERLVGIEQRLRSQTERPAAAEAAPPPVETPALPHADDHARVTGTSPEVSPAAPDTRRPAVSQTVEQAEFETVSDEDTGSSGFDFEELFGRRLPIWAGGITLAVGGIFLVRLAIESGLMTPLVRVAASFVFGLILLAAAEAAHRFEARLADTRVRQALAGAGLATLYAAFYLAGSVYGLIGPGAAFVGLAVVTAAALGLASRFGLPTALLGLVGGFATPAMVASNDPNLPLLSFYLALLAAGIAFTGRRMGAAWLGMIALLGGFGWGAVILAAVPVERADLLASGIFLVALGAAVPALASDRTRSAAWAQTAAAALASIQLAVLMLLNDFDLLGWGLYLLLLIALAALGWRETAIRRGGHFAAAVGIALLVPWAPDASLFAPVAAALAVVCAGGPLALAWLRRADEGDLWQGAAVPAAISAIAVLHFHSGEGIQPVLATALLALGALGTAGLLLAERTGGGARFAWGYGGGIALIAYLLFLALVPEAAMGWCLAVAGGAILLAQPARYHTALVLLAIALGWAVPPLVVWLTATLPAVYGS
ncbi:MAG: hypothetical protein CL808_05745, partial [Citromicrobium sp.]|nr:hypothetical protein [Citromicrobium sp.]